MSPDERHIKERMENDDTFQHFINQKRMIDICEPVVPSTVYSHTFTVFSLTKTSMSV